MTTPKKTPAKKRATAPSTNLRERVLDDAQTLRLPLSAEMLDAALSRAAQEGLSHLTFFQLILGEPAVRSRQRAVERRIGEARFREEKTLAQFDWKFITKGGQWTPVPLRGGWFPEAFMGTMSNLQRFAAGEDQVLHTRVEDAGKTMALIEALYESNARGATPIP